MAIKISYEWCLETLDEYEPGKYDIVEPLFADVGNKDYYTIEDLLKNMDGSLFQFGIKKWFYNTDWDEYDCQYIYLTKDKTFTDELPKYLLKKVSPYIDTITKHPNFKE